MEGTKDVLRERNRELGRLLQEARLQRALPLSTCATLIHTSQGRYLAMEAGESPIGAAELEVLVRLQIQSPEDGRSAGCFAAV
jgi:hypothetical protein